MFRELAGPFVALCVLTAAGAAGASTNLLVNGDFEDGPPSIGTGANAYYRGLPAGWQSVLDEVDIIEDGYGQGADPQYAVLLTAHSGTHFLDMNGAGSAGTIGQTVTGLTAGSLIRLSLWTGQWAQNSSDAHVTYVLRDGVTNAILGSGATVTDGQGWTHQSLSAIATGSSVRVELGGFTSFQAGSGLDDVSLSVGVPEPASWALMIAGFGGIGAMLRRRRDTAAVA